MTSPRFEIIGIGEILWDLLPAGKQLGGAPANFVCHAHALSASARLISRVGRDPNGREILERFAAVGVPTDTIGVDADAPTGTVSVEILGDGQPRFTIHEKVAWDRIEANAEALAAVQKADAICFGTLAQRTASARRAIATLVAAARPNAWRIFDINLRPPFVENEVISDSLGAANVLKLNEQELPVLAGLFRLQGPVTEQLASLANRFGLRVIALTRGAEGSVLYVDGVIVEQPSVPTKVVDTVGAGDSFTAALAAGLLRGWTPAKIIEHASAIAAFVCSQPGATPPLPEDLRAPYLDREARRADGN